MLSKAEDLFITYLITICIVSLKLRNVLSLNSIVLRSFISEQIKYWGKLCL